MLLLRHASEQEHRSQASSCEHSKEHKPAPWRFTMSEQVLSKAKKSVALSGVAPASTALCTVGRSGNDLHYRCYDITDQDGKGSYEVAASSLPTRTVASRNIKLKSGL